MSPKSPAKISVCPLKVQPKYLYDPSKSRWNIPKLNCLCHLEWNLIFFFTAQSLIPKLKDPDPNPAVTISVLAAIGEQAQVSGVEMRKPMDELLPIILDILQDSSALQKREVCGVRILHGLSFNINLYETSLRHVIRAWRKIKVCASK